MAIFNLHPQTKPPLNYNMDVFQKYPKMDGL